MAFGLVVDELGEVHEPESFYFGDQAQTIDLFGLTYYYLLPGDFGTVHYDFGSFELDYPEGDLAEPTRLKRGAYEVLDPFVDVGGVFGVPPGSAFVGIQRGPDDDEWWTLLADLVETETQAVIFGQTVPDPDGVPLVTTKDNLVTGFEPMAPRVR